jgi:hypothetical protein
MIRPDRIFGTWLVEGICMGEVPDPRRLTPAKLIAILDGREIRVQAAMARLQMAVTLIDMAGRGLAPYVMPRTIEDLLELSVALGRIEINLGRRILVKPKQPDRTLS